MEYAGRAREYHQQHGQARAAARAEAIAASALRMRGRFAAAREQVTAALTVLRTNPDADTVNALRVLASLENFAGSPAGEQLAAEALGLGQALGLPDAVLARLLTSRGICHRSAERKTEAAAYFREAARLATQAGDNLCAGTALSTRPTHWPAPTRRPPRKQPALPPRTCAGRAPVITWDSRWRTWPRRWS